MSARDDGGYAFPQTETRAANAFGVEYGHGGMSLRDWFAGKAMQGFISNNPDIAFNSPSGMAEDAYRMADAMLTERGRK